MCRKIAALVIMALGVSAVIPAAAQVLNPIGPGTGRYMVQYRSGRGWPWRLYTRTRSRVRAYAIAAQVRTAGFQSRVVYGSYYASMPYSGYGYGYGYPRRYGRGYGRSYGYGRPAYLAYRAPSSAQVSGAVNALAMTGNRGMLMGASPSAAGGSASRTNPGAAAHRVGSAARTQAQHAVVHHVARNTVGGGGTTAALHNQLASFRAHAGSGTRAAVRPNTAGQHAAAHQSAVHFNYNRGAAAFRGGGAAFRGGGGGFHGGGFHGGGFHGGGGGAHGGGGHR